MIAVVSIIFTTFVGVCLMVFGWQPSISNIFNVLPKGWKWLFTLFMVVLGTFCIAIGKNNAMTLMGFACWLVGFFPRFNDDQEKQHYISAIGIIGSGLWQVGVVYKEWWLPLIFICCLPLLLRVRNKTFWIEIVFFIIFLVGLSLKN
jgi:hypothetical protein